MSIAAAMAFRSTSSGVLGFLQTFFVHASFLILQSVFACPAHARKGAETGMEK